MRRFTVRAVPAGDRAGRCGSMRAVAAKPCSALRAVAGGSVRAVPPVPPSARAWARACVHASTHARGPSIPSSGIRLSDISNSLNGRFKGEGHQNFGALAPSNRCRLQAQRKFQRGATNVSLCEV
jgi:hypothetical protein